MYKHNVHVKGYIHAWPSMPSSHACMPLFTTWYALIPGIILPLRGGIRPYAPPHREPLSPRTMADAGQKKQRATEQGSKALRTIHFAVARSPGNGMQPILDLQGGDAVQA